MVDMDIIRKFQDEIERMKNEARNIYIVNAGRMNHGKSSLFNSLLDSDIFAVGDIRVTKERQDADFDNGVYLVDTPGLDANEEDDAVALNVYKKANMIVFVHTPNTGELHKDEIDHINKIADLFPNREYFWKHFCLVFTFKEAVSPEELAIIREKSINDIKTNCGGFDFPVFEISNSRYQKGMRENKQGLVKHSGINELKNFLKENINTWINDNHQLLIARIDKQAEEVKKLLKSKRDNVENKIQRNRIAINNEIDHLRDSINSSFETIEYYMIRYDGVKWFELCDLQEEYKKLEEKLDLDRANFKEV